jgi:putative tryptophan/tyrosine transport system substrate-binding protein
MDISARAISLPDRPRTGHLGHHSTDDPEAQPRVAAFESGLRELGWLDGRNLRIECRWAILRSIAAELARMPPDLILATSTPVMAALQEQGLSVFRRNRASLK